MIANKIQRKIFWLSVIFLSIFPVLFFFGVNLVTGYYFIHFDKKVAFYRFAKDQLYKTSEALRQYKTIYGRYPSETEGLQALVTEGLITQKLINRIMDSPYWTDNYHLHGKNYINQTPYEYEITIVGYGMSVVYTHLKKGGYFSDFFWPDVLDIYFLALYMLLIFEVCINLCILVILRTSAI